MELRKVYGDDFEQIYPLLLGFRNREMSKEAWRRMLFGYPWANGAHCGYATVAAGKIVGFLGTIFSERPIAGAVERFCNFSSWIVEEEHRGPSALMMRSVVADLPDHTLVGYTPAPVTVRLFTRLGFEPFERHQLLIAPSIGLTGRRSLADDFTVSASEIERSLTGAELTIHRDLIGSRAHSVLLRRGDAQCYIVARSATYRGLPVADILYLGDRNFFWENRALAHRALLTATHTPLLAVDERLTEGRKLRFSMRIPRVRIYRPTRPSITPLAIDGLYSELIMLWGVPLSWA